MTEAKHTPKRFIVNGDWDSAGNARYTLVGVKFVDGLTAQLIAAAPETAAERDELRKINAELVKALKTVVRVAGDRHTDEFDMARAAIARAEGRS